MTENRDIEGQLDQLLETANHVTEEISRQGSAVSDLQEEGAAIADLGQNSLEVARRMTSRRYRLWYWLRDTVQSLFGGEENRTNLEGNIGRAAPEKQEEGTRRMTLN